MQQEYYPDQEPEQPPQRSAEPRRKQGFLGGLFAPEEETEELMIPEERAEGASPRTARELPPPQQPVQTPSAAAVPVQSEPPVPPAQEETSTQEVWRSKYTRPARRAAEESGHTVEIIQGTVGYAKPPVRAVALRRHDRYDLPQKEEHRGVHPRPEDPEGPAAAACAAAQWGACGRAHRDAPRPDVHRLHDADRRAGRRPRGQHAGLYGRLQRRAPAAPPGSRAGAARSAPCRRPPRRMLCDESAAVDESSWAKHDGTGQWPVPRQWDDVDTLVNTLTGNIHLTPTAPEHSGYTQNSASGTAPSAPAHSGFTQRIDMPAVPAPGSPANAGSQALYPAHTGFTQRLDPAPAQPAHSGYTQNLNQQASAAPDTAPLSTASPRPSTRSSRQGTRAIMTALRRG